MRKIVSIALLLLWSFLNLAAQNNAYDLNDECYKYFREAELLVGKDGFEKVNGELLHSAITHEDTKAQTLYYVERLKHACRVIPTQVLSTQEQDEQVLQMQEDLKDIADKFGYPQYFYYSYELVQTYFYNHLKPVRTLELLQEMQQTASKRGEQYGEWQSYRYLVALYISQSDYETAKRYILQALHLHESTRDPLVRKQSVAHLYCDLSDTYVIGADSVKINILKAVKSCQVHLDTLRCEYHLAKLSAYEKRVADYRRHRDYCLADRSLNTISPTAKKLFETLDSIIEGHFDFHKVNDLAFSRVREVKYIANVARFLLVLPIEPPQQPQTNK